MIRVDYKRASACEVVSPLTPLLSTVVYRGKKVPSDTSTLTLTFSAPRTVRTGQPFLINIHSEGRQKVTHNRPGLPRETVGLKEVTRLKPVPPLGPELIVSKKTR